MGKRGPTTARGREAVRRNAVKHGLRSDDPVVTAHESPADWKRHRDAIIESLSVEGHLETELADRVALLLWRLKRVARYETDMTNQYIQNIPDDMVMAATYAKGALNIPTEEAITLEKVGNLIDRRLLPSGEILERVMRYEAHLHRQLIQTLRELEALQARRNGQRVSPLARLDVSGSPL
jgi:hypothetical protein